MSGNNLCRKIFAIAAVIFSMISPPDAICGQASYSLWSDTVVPLVIDAGPESPVELGVKFSADTSGYIDGIRFYKASANSGSHVGNLWTATGTLLATATFTNETASGWQQVNFSTPVPVTANTVYVASYHTNTGNYSYDLNYFSGKGVDNPPLHSPADGVSGGNGVYAYGSNSVFPTQSWNSSNYWVDVVFSVASQLPLPLPLPAANSAIWPDTTVPLVIDAGPESPVELGVKFSADTSGYINGIRFYKASANSGSHVGSLWTATGTLLATATFINETASGWQKVNFSTPVPVTANMVYVASYHTNTGNYSYDLNYFSGKGVDNPPLHSPADGVSGGNGLYAYGSNSVFPDQTWKGTNYWVDVMFSAGASSGTTPPPVTVSGPESAGWYAGDMHVHRSCGGSPEEISTVFQKMNPQNLAVISLLADSGNGEVQNAYTDLPLVTGRNDSVSLPEKIMHWDTEWHWDPIYWQFPFQALGGHIVSLGLSEAHQIREEYTYPIFDWARKQNGISGFAHMQYLDNAIPQSLSCCTPIEYPVEVALGSTDFISEDVFNSGSKNPNMYSDGAIQAYYRLLNCGFRPAFAAGTDYPCGNSELGSLLTYVQVAGGVMTYRNWIEGIAKGRTVVSRNGHREFLDFKVNNSATPGDEIKLTGGGTVQVTIKWTATESLSGTIELVHNGVVVAGKQASAAAGAPAILSAAVNFTKSGWLVARRMGSDGHQVHTGAVYVTVDNAPVRASVADANFYVQWMDNLLAKTSPGGVWNQYFTNNLNEAQSRYKAAKTLYQQIALETGATPTEATIFTGQTPTTFGNESAYELGTKFWADVNGQVTQVRLYTNALEGGNHTVRIWRASDATVVAGPYNWNIPAGIQGWKSFTLPTSLSITANTDYIVTVSNSADQYYASQENGLNKDTVNGNLHTYVGSGVYSTILGTMPTSNWNNSNYFRDVVFISGISGKI